MYRVGVGSKNKTKIEAVSELLKDYQMFDGARVEAVDVKVKEFDHPKSIEETVAGAIYRAKQSYAGHDYGFGIEGGLMAVPQTKSGYMEVAVCAIYDGEEIHLGMSQGCEWPKKVTDLILNHGMDGSQAFKAVFGGEGKVGEGPGMIHHFTKGRINRKQFNKSAVSMALVHLENPEHY